MSVCVGVLTKDYIILASDSRASYEDGKYKDTLNKILDIPNGGTLLVSGGVGAGQKLARLLGQHNNPLDVPINEIPDEPPHCLYMNKERSQLIEIDSGFGVMDVCEGGYMCLGSGGDVAEVSIIKQLGKRSFKSMDYKQAVKIVKQAIEDACTLNLFCGGDVVVKVYKRSA